MTLYKVFTVLKFLYTAISDQSWSQMAVYKVTYLSPHFSLSFLKPIQFQPKFFVTSGSLSEEKKEREILYSAISDHLGPK